MKTFTAVTYNVLAQPHVHLDRYPLSRPEALDPARRRVLLLDRVVGLDADLLCLQEVEPAIHDDLRARLDATHHTAYTRPRARPDGLAVIARHATFAWHGHDVLRYQARRRGIDGAALIVRLALHGQPLRVACTHLAWQPDSTPPAEHVGLRQMLELLARRDGAAGDNTWILAGDLNATSESAVVAAALQRGMSESCRSQHPWDTSVINGRPRKIDYLLHSTGRLTPHPGVLPKLTRDSVPPSLTEPSDHLPLRVDFT